MNIILVHGFLNRPGILSKLATFLTREGHHCLLPTLAPSDARFGIPDLSAQLDTFIRTSLPNDARLLLVGFSMGAIVSRHYLQERDGSLRADGFFSIAGPHKGTRLAWLYPGLGTSHMRPGSAFLEELARSEHQLRDLPVVSYWTPFDLMIRPLSSAQWERGEVVKIKSPAHFLMPGSSRLHRDLAARIRRLAIPKDAEPA